MKKDAKTAMTAAVFAAALGISAGGTVPVDAAVYLAATDQRTMQILYGPGPDFEKPVSGDLNGDKILDARDLSLIKQRLLNGTENYSYTADFLFDMDDDGADARALMQHLTGEADAENKRPVSFTLFFKPVPYFSDEVPEVMEERFRLTEEANLRLRRIENYLYRNDAPAPEFVYALTQQQEKKLLPYDLESEEPPFWGSALERIYRMKVPDGFAPNTFFDDGADETGVVCQHRTEITLSMPFEDQPLVISGDSEDPDDGLPAPMMQHSVQNYSFPTYTRYADGHEAYFDKLLIEWNVNTGEFRMHECLTPEQNLPE